MGLWSWLCCPGRTAPQHFMMHPGARRPSAAPRWAGYPHPGGPSTPSRGSATRRLTDLVGSVALAPRIRGVTRTRVVRSVAARGGSPRFRLVSVSALPLAVVAWGVVRPGGRRWRACRCSRGRRPIGSDTEATDPLEPLPQRHRSGVGGRLTRTRLRHACRLQRPCSLPRCSC